MFIITRQKDTQKIHWYPILETTVILGDFTPKKSSLLALIYKRKNWDKRSQPFASHRIPSQGEIYHFQTLLIPHAL